MARETKGICLEGLGIEGEMAGNLRRINNIEEAMLAGNFS